MSKTEMPSIRFYGFDNDWEQRKLGGMASLITKGTTPFDKSNTGVVNFVKIESIDESSGNITITQKISLDEHNGYLHRSQLKENDILFSIAGTLGRVTSVKSSILPANTNQALAIIRLKDGCLDYVKTYLKGKAVADFIKKNPTIGAQPNLSLEQVANLEIAIPSEDEQKIIGAFFQQLDNLIALHQRKIEKLTNVKKSMLEKMFPQNGSSYPEIRFKGFTDPWEQRKLEDYLTVSTEKNTGNIYGRSDVLSVSGDYGIVNQIEFQGRSFAGASVLNYGVVQTGDVVYTKSPLNSNPYGIIKTNKGKPGIVSTLYAVYHPKENTFSNFIQVYFEQHSRMNNYMHPLVNKGAKNDMKVSAENALKGPVCFPSRVEQESISAFFSVLDHLITLHQRELEKLQSIKKALLEKMFV